MKSRKLFCLKLTLPFLLSQGFLICSMAQSKTDPLLAKILKSHPAYFEQILKHPSQYSVQIIYTQIDRNTKNEPRFKTYHYQVDKNNYFYPASTVKLPAVLLSLEKLNNLGIPDLDKDTPMCTEAARPEQTSVSVDSTSENGVPSVAHYAKKILLVSNNDAFNRLYEFIGQEAFNESLYQKGYPDVRIQHRLQIPLSTEENKFTNPIHFEKEGKVLYQQPMAYSNKNYQASSPILLGKGYKKDGVLVNEPMDFADKNYFALEDQHELLKAIFFPEAIPVTKRFNLKPDDYEFLYRYMSQLPIETSYPETYSTLNDATVKFLLFGNSPKRMPRSIRIFNKIGGAYGYLIDNAYIVDFEKGIEFLLSAVIYCNEDGILNDDNYDYDKVGYPFMRNLGKVIFEHELKRRENKKRPNLNRYEVEYDK